MIGFVGDSVSGGIVGTDDLRLGFGVPRVEAVLIVGEVGYSIDNMTFHFLYIMCLPLWGAIFLVCLQSKKNVVGLDFGDYPFNTTYAASSTGPYPSVLKVVTYPVVRGGEFPGDGKYAFD